MVIKKVFVNCHISSEIIRNLDMILYNPILAPLHLDCQRRIYRGCINLTYFAYVKDSVTEEMCYLFFSGQIILKLWCFLLIYYKRESSLL